jgi:hypothetical protein
LCGVTRTTSHKWDGGTVTQAPNCIAEGIKTYTCTSCKETKTESVQKSASHTYDHLCDTDCNLCGEKRVTSHIPGAPATETTDQLCTQCGAVLMPATGPAPSDPTTPTTPTQPTEPTVPADPTEPTVPADPTEPEAPTTGTEPGQPEQTQPTTGQNVPVVSVTESTKNDASNLVIVVILITAAAIGVGILLIVFQKRKVKH